MLMMNKSLINLLLVIIIAAAANAAIPQTDLDRKVVKGIIFHLHYIVIQMMMMTERGRKVVVYYH